MMAIQANNDQTKQKWNELYAHIELVDRFYDHKKILYIDTNCDINSIIFKEFKENLTVRG